VTSGPGAIVLDSNHAALAAVRSLGRRGIPVWLVQKSASAATYSRYTRRAIRWSGGEDARAGLLLALADREGADGWTVFPTDDDGVALLARHRPTLERRFRIAAPPWETARWAYDKRLTYRLAGELGVPFPRTWFPDREGVDTLDCTFPVVLKPAVKETSNEFTEARAWRIEDRASLVERHAAASRLVGPDVVMVQELVPGGGTAQLSYGALCVDGTPIATIVARRLRQHPADFGRFSTCVETVECPEVEDAARRFLAGLRYTGLVEIEFKRDADTGRHLLLDVNPRLWGWHGLGEAAGTDFPWLHWRLLAGDVPEPTRARRGVRWVLLRRDVSTAVREIRAGRLAPLAYLLSLRPPLAFAIVARDDPAPAILDVPLILGARARGIAAAAFRGRRSVPPSLRPSGSRARAR
jgi:D-aspartate ligase